MANASNKVVICGAGIAGVAAAYYLAVEHGHADVVILDAASPLSLTSDKSTEAYRNWWPGPDEAMTAFMNRSIDLMEGIARATDNRINMNRRGWGAVRSACTRRLRALTGRRPSTASQRP